MRCRSMRPKHVAIWEARSFLESGLNRVSLHYMNTTAMKLEYLNRLIEYTLIVDRMIMYFSLDGSMKCHSLDTR